MRREDRDGVFFRVVHLVVERGHRGWGICVGSRGSDAVDERARVERPRRPAARARRLRVREHRRIRELRSVVVESVHWEHHRDVVARGGVEFVAHGGRERALAGSRGARDADEHARVAVAVAVERRRGEPRGELVDHRVHVLARGRPRRLHAGQGARR